ncbi:MAG: PHP domain-containing protein, partial [Patescibacteria group bacterium]
HNIQTRLMAIKKGLKLNEYGVFRGKKMLVSDSEEKVYEILGIPWMEPELRENRGELQAALLQARGKKGVLPKIIGYDGIRGDLHCHSSWAGQANSVEEIMETAKEMGYEYIGIPDHTKFLKIEHGLNEEQLLSQGKEIEKINSRLRQGFDGQAKLKKQNSNFRILHGCEANILEDGRIDIKDKILQKLDYVIAGVHSRFKMREDQMTERITKAMRNSNVDIISHPTGRLLQRRDEYKINLEKILKVAKETGTVLEIDSYPERLDLNDVNIKKAKEVGVKMVINTDSHQRGQLRHMELGIAQARRGWAEKKDIINSHSLEKMLKFLKQH